jgi:hypothetical protein
MPRQYDLHTYFLGSLHKGFEVVDLKPEEHTVAIGLICRVADTSVMMFNIEAMQLQNEPAVFHQLLIVLASMSTATAEQTLVPLAAGFNICDTDQGLREHGPKPSSFRSERPAEEKAASFGGRFASVRNSYLPDRQPFCPELFA